LEVMIRRKKSQLHKDLLLKSNSSSEAF
jgi:hypothetical protein